MRSTERSAIGTALVVAVVIIIVAAAGVGVYFATSGSSSSTTTSQSTTQSQTQATTTTSSSQSTLVTTSQATTSSSASTTPTGTTTTTTSTSAPTTQTTQTTTGVSCSTTFTSTTATSQNLGTTIQTEIIPLLQSFSNLSVTFSGTSNGTSYNERGTYGVVSRSTSGGVTTYNMIIDFISGSTSENASVSVASNGTVSAEVGGYPLPGSEAQALFVGYMAPFTIDSTFVNELQVYTGSYFMSNGTFIQTYAGTNGAVLHETSYVAANLPETFSQCGVSATLNAFHMDVAQLQGTNVYIVTYLHLDGTSNGQNGDFTLDLNWAATYG